MKRLIATLAALVIFSLAGLAAQKEKTFSGDIMDGACAKAGSHAAMMKKAGVKTAKECTLACVKNGSKFVLYNKAHKKIYQLDDQTKPEQFAGEHVTVKGTLDASTNTIHVMDIEAAKTGHMKPKPASKPGM